MESQIIAKVSRGTNMDQVYLPKNRSGMQPGEYVIINVLANTPVPETKKSAGKLFKPYFYGLGALKQIEPIKLQIISDIFDISAKFVQKESNIIITGSFLDSGFNFNDVDIIILSKNADTKGVEGEIMAKVGIKPHIIALSKEEFSQGLASDPLYQTMISRCAAKGRLIFNFKPMINAQLLDMHLLKSKALIDNFELLNGKEKYYLTFNLISILLFIQRGKITKDLVEKAIKREFGVKKLEEIKENLIDETFLKKYKTIYNKTFNKIMGKLKNGSK